MAFYKATHFVKFTFLHQSLIDDLVFIYKLTYFNFHKTISFHESCALSTYIIRNIIKFKFTCIQAMWQNPFLTFIDRNIRSLAQPTFFWTTFWSFKSNFYFKDVFIVLYEFIEGKTTFKALFFSYPLFLNWILILIEILLLLIFWFYKS